MWIKKPKISIGVKASFVYTFASLLSKGLAIITVPIFTRLMTTEEMGVVNIYNSWHSMISVVASLSLTSGGLQLAMKEFEGERDQYLSSVLSLTSLMAILLGIIYCVAPQMWNNLMGMPTSLMLLMFFHLLLFPAYEFWLMRQRYEYKYKSAGVMSIASAILASAVSVSAVIIATQAGSTQVGVVRLYANYLIQLSIAFALWIYIFAKGQTIFSKRFWHFSLALSIPLIGNSFASQILNVSDRVMIGKMVGSSAVGIYGVLYTVSSISLLVWNSINASFVPFLFNNLDKPEKRQRIQSTASGLLFAFSMVAFLLTLVAPEIVRIMATEEYYEAIYIMPPIAAGVFLTSITNLYSNVLIYYKKTKFIMISTIIAATVNVVMNYCGIKAFGYQVAAYTTLIAYIIHAVIQGIVSLKVYRTITGDKNGEIYNTKAVIVLTSFTIVACLLCIPIYEYLWLRYLIVVAVFLLALVYHKKILQHLNLTRR